MRVCQRFVITRVVAHGPSWLGIYLPPESGWKDSVFFSTRFLEIHGDEPSCWQFVSTSLEIVVQGRHVFKFNQAWISSELLSTRLLRPPCCRLRDGGGAAPVEVCPWSIMVASHASLCEWMPFLDTLLCFQFWRLRCPVGEKFRRELLHLPRVSDIGNSKLGESTGLKCSTSLLMHDLIIDYANVGEEFFCVFFCITNFPKKKHKIK